MAVNVSSMFIPVHDPDAALGFYRDALGLEVRNDVASDGFRWVTVGAPGQDVDIVLFQPHGGLSQAEGDALLALVTQGSLQAAIFRTDDLDATFEKARASGESEERLYLVSAWRESPLFTARERAALRWTEALTLLADAGASDGDYAELCEHFSESERVKLSMLIVAINGWNRIAVGFRLVHPTQSDRAAA